MQGLNAYEFYKKLNKKLRNRNIYTYASKRFRIYKNRKRYLPLWLPNMNLWHSILLKKWKVLLKMMTLICSISYSALLSNFKVLLKLRRNSKKLLKLTSLVSKVTILTITSHRTWDIKERVFNNPEAETLPKH